MWEQDEFAKHWRSEFPDGDVPRMDLNSVEDIESELEKCKSNMKRLQKALAEEKFKVIYLETTVTRRKRSEPEKPGAEEENLNAPLVSSQTGDIIRKPLRRDDGGGGEKVVSDPAGLLKPHAAASTPGAFSAFSRELGRFSGRTGKPVPIPVPPPNSGFGRGNTARKAPAAAPRVVDHEEDSDREYEDAELNETFVRNNLLTPNIPGRNGQRTTSYGRGPIRHSRDFDSVDDGRLSPQAPRRLSPGSRCSTPERRSDGDLSSDHEDSSSAGNDSPVISKRCSVKS